VAQTRGRLGLSTIPVHGRLGDRLDLKLDSQSRVQLLDRIGFSKESGVLHEALSFRATVMPGVSCALLVAWISCCGAPVPASCSGSEK
jgi:hypothetical protein